MMSKKAIKIICIILAALMAMSVFAVVLQTFAVGSSAFDAAAIPVTGESNWPYIIPAIVIGCAVIAILCAVLIPKIKNKKKSKEKEN